jgi:hypothetical protein
MKSVVLIAGLIVVVALGALAFVAVSVPRKGVMETFAELHDTRLGSAYVRGRYDGFLNGWDVSFFHRDGEGRWFSYYLAHESRRWRNAELRAEGSLFIINNGDKTIAEYDTLCGTFKHKLLGVTYTKQDGLEGALEANRRTRTVKPPE